MRDGAGPITKPAESVRQFCSVRKCALGQSQFMLGMFGDFVYDFDFSLEDASKLASTVATMELSSPVVFGMVTELCDMENLDYRTTTWDR